MSSRVALVLDSLNLKNLCLFYFFLSPFFQDSSNETYFNLILAAGYAASFAVLGMAAAQMLARLSDRVFVDVIALLVLGMIAMCFFSLAVNTPEKLTSLMAYYYKYLKLICAVGCFFVLTRTLDLREISRLYSLVLAAGLCALLALIPEYLLFPQDDLIPRLSSYFLDSNKYAAFLNVILGMTLPRLIGQVLRKEPIGFSVVVLGLVIFQLLLAQSRGGILTSVVIALVCFAPRPGRKVFMKALPYLIIPMSIFGLVFALRYFVADSAGGSDVQRLVTYMVGLNIIADRPFLGIGFANIVTVYNVYGAEALLFLGQPMAIHNAILEIFAEEGFFGMILYLLLVFVPISLLAKKIRKSSGEGHYPVLEISALNIPIAFFGFGLFCPNYLAEYYFWSYMAFTVIILRMQVPREMTLRAPRPKWI